MKRIRQNEAERISASIAKDAEAVAQLLEDASHIQWIRPTSKAPEETPRARGVFGNPVEETALDVRRLRVREAYKQALVSFVKAFDDLARARNDLTNALEAWKSDK